MLVVAVTPAEADRPKRLAHKLRNPVHIASLALGKTGLIVYL